MKALIDISPSSMDVSNCFLISEVYIDAIEYNSCIGTENAIADS